MDKGGAPGEGCKIDVWRANDEGFYDVQHEGIQPDFDPRGVFRTGAGGDSGGAATTTTGPGGA